MKQLTPCPHITSALERIAEGKEKGGLFMWYVQKHVERCSHCAEALDALKCYQDAVQEAYQDVQKEGASDISAEDLSSILSSIRVSD